MDKTMRYLLGSFFTFAVAGAVGSPLPPPPPRPALPTVLPTVTSAGPGTGPVSGPIIEVSSPVFDFGRANSGDIVKHTFKFKNTGNQVLVVSNVQPSCGCTAAGQWTREVKPGETGTIPIQFNSRGYRGVVAKMITVISNAKNEPRKYLQLKGTIWIPIEVFPIYPVLTVTPELPPSSKIVGITNNTDGPVAVFAPAVNNPGLQVELRTNQVGKAYELIVSPAKPLPKSSLRGQITLRTSLPKLPELTITAFLNYQPLIQVWPSGVYLPPGPLPGTYVSTLTFFNHSTNALALSDPVLSGPTGKVDNVKVVLNQIQPGRFFNVKLTFPEGFEVAQNESFTFHIKSNKAAEAEITLPVHQFNRPAPRTVPRPVPYRPAPTKAPQTPVPPSLFPSASSAK